MSKESLCDFCLRLWDAEHCKSLDTVMLPSLVCLKRNKTLDTALHFAASCGHVKCTRELLALGANTRAINSQSNMPIHLALHNEEKENCFECVQLMLEKDNTLVNCQSYYGSFPLHTICNFKTEKAIELFHLMIKIGADVHAKSCAEHTALHIASYRGNDLFVRELLLHGANINELSGSGFDYSTSLYLSVLNRHLHCVKLFHEFGADANIQNNEGSTLLHLIASYKNWHRESHCVEYVLKNMKVNINTRDKKGNTPLHIAALNGILDYIKLLLEHGADPFFENNDHKTAEQLAIDHISNVFVSWNTNYAKSAKIIRKTIESRNIPDIKCAIDD